MNVFVLEILTYDDDEGRNTWIRSVHTTKEAAQADWEKYKSDMQIQANDGDEDAQMEVDMLNMGHLSHEIHERTVKFQNPGE